MPQIIDRTSRRVMLDALRNAILTQKLSPGEKLKSTDVLASQYGVASRTAHRVLNELVNEGLLKRERGRGTFVPEWRESRKVEAGSVALLLHAGGHVWGELFQGLSRELKRHGYKPFLYDLSEDIDESIHEILENPLDAVITLNLTAAGKIVKLAPKMKVIAISISEQLNFPGDIIGPDGYESGALGTKHLLGHGKREICLACLPKSDTQINADLCEPDLIKKGYAAVMQEAGLQEDVVVFENRDAWKAAWEHFKDRKLPEALLVQNDCMAAEIIDSLREHGVRIPGDIAVVSMHNTPWADAYKLTSIDSRFRLAAEYCAELIADQHRGSRQRIRINPELVIRTSCGCKREKIR